MKGFRKTFGAMAGLLLVLCASCATENSWHVLRGSVWGTSFNIKYESEHLLDDTIVSSMRHVELVFSPFDPESEMAQINRGERNTMSTEAAMVFNVAKQVNQLTDRAFDPTVRPLLKIWGFGDERKYPGKDGRFTPPTQAEIDSALALVGIDKCSLQGGKLVRKHPQTTFDFSGIAKGYGVDVVAKTLKAHEVENFLVEIGGEVVACGHNESGEPWQISIDNPAAGDHAAPGVSAVDVVALEKGAVATSGNYRNYHDMDNGKRVGHIISPKNGVPVDTEVLSATVVADKCALADALATACMTMPLDEVRRMFRDNAAALKNVGALLVVKTGDSSKPLKIETAGHWPESPQDK